MFHFTRPSAILCAALIAALALLAACGGDDDEAPDGSATATPAATTTVPLPSGSGCVPGDGPPAEGEAEGLEGTITYVRLVFGCQPDVYIMDANGDGSRPLADDASIDDESDLSADGSKIVFFSGREGNAFLYVVNSDGSGLTRLTQGSGGDTSPRWSPDGTKIAFSQSGSLVVMNADATGANVIMESQAATDAAPCRAGSFVGGWSPDGTQIVYYSAVVRSDAANLFWLCTVPVDGGEPTVLIDEPGLHAEPYWSPDGTKIVYRDDVGGTCTLETASDCNYDIMVLDLETRDVTNVTNAPDAFDIEPVWSPDGEWILFASNRDDPNFDLYVIHPDGTGLQRVLADPDSKDSYPSWH